MATAKSPFLIYQNFISPLKCEEIISDLRFFDPDVNASGKPIKMSRRNLTHEEYIYNLTQSITPEIFEHYGAEYKGTEEMQFEYLAEGVHDEPVCGNSQYLRSKWVRTRDRDFTAVLFLTDYSDNPAFDIQFETYGGKLEFPQHGFSFEPERGTLVVFPSLPHFIHVNTPVSVGDLFQVKLNFAAKKPYMYDPADFPGDYRSWFANL